MNDGFYLLGNAKSVENLFLSRLRKGSQGQLGNSSPPSDRNLDIIYFGDSIISDIAFNPWHKCYVETDLDYPEWVEQLTPDPMTRLLEYTVEKYTTNRVRT